MLLIRFTYIFRILLHTIHSSIAMVSASSLCMYNMTSYITSAWVCYTRLKPSHGLAGGASCSGP